MRVFFIASALCAVSAAMPGHASALCLVPSSQACEQLLIQKAELARSKALGGYTDPLTALSNLFNGTTDPVDIQRPITTYREAEEWLPNGKYLDGAGNLRPEYQALAR